MLPPVGVIRDAQYLTGTLTPELAIVRNDNGVPVDCYLRPLPTAPTTVTIR